MAVPEDGLTFNTDDLDMREIREGTWYGGLRARFTACLGTARIPVQIDFGIGDAVTPAATEVTYPTLLPMPRPRLRAYPRETVVAEKLEAIVDLGLDNSRMKDYFDLWFIVTAFEHDFDTLAAAVTNTFRRRGQPLPQDVPIGLTDAFASDETKRRQWKAFLSRSVGRSLSLSEAITEVREFALPIFERARHLHSSGQGS